jgi:hypothetical protein
MYSCFSLLVVLFVGDIFDRIEPVTTRFGSGTFYSEVLNYSSSPFTREIRSTNAHETTHTINSTLRGTLRGVYPYKVNAFFVGSGNYVALREPNIALRDVGNYIPSVLRGRRFNLYFVQQLRYWDDSPLYVLDEFVSYINGGKVCVDDLENNRYNQGNTDGVSGCLEFAIYSVGLIKCIEARDPGYFEREPKFLPFMDYIINEAGLTFFKGSRYRQLYSPTQNNLLRRLRTESAAKEVLEVLEEKFNLDNYNLRSKLKNKADNILESLNQSKLSERKKLWNP